MGGDITHSAGKGSRPRNNFSRAFRSNYETVFGPKARKVCPHGIPLGESCDACLRAMPKEFLGSTGIKKKFKATDLKGS